ncbi:glycosyltransferase family 39 protein [Suhomyces tanzawaensis NRRL Y-17324]|uniref:Dolichyl-phosphate-mannose--protein mannosyltransferase n=1 Tax=Suhomyces tanzawaensis NRRL Y-17324 TaxID=984487 RepID=A0A1E4SHY3_9ASCO|nr:glycosyltransferase family 39 protein [Suhomyces tanzawaensis NRRL Y-17324]ODV79111.1 glycosyltransferase family 39 protein [Suhomyces tanzawaensis NRRL Y-17324]
MPKAKSPSTAARAAAISANKPASVFSVDPVVPPVYSQGPVRSFLVSTPTPAVIKKRLIVDVKELYLLAVLLVVSLAVRFYNLSGPNLVVFDEVHFGGFARKYILGKFFMDVHPPLAKMLFAAVGSLGGFDGEFEFKNIGDVFPQSVPYVLMRQFPAVLGIGTVILCYLTLRSSGVRPIVSFITTLLFIVENSNVTISRYILLDSPLVFFIAASVYAWKKFEIQIPFTGPWFASLVATGIALGLAVLSKWVGLFTIAWVGILCVYQLWFIIGDLTVLSKKVVGHFFARGLILLGVPAFLYLFFFAIHFQVLNQEGDGSAFMSSAFRAGLQGNSIPTNINSRVGLGSVVTLRHVDTLGGYLHSHAHFYPTGSKQQQITLYPHLDSNNDWKIEPYNESIPEKFVPLTDGVKIRLVHVNSGRRLHSHDEKPPVSERDWQKEASCYGYEGFEGDANDDFIVEIVDYRSEAGDAQNNVLALKTIFRLKHAMSGNYLFSSEVKLPEWGFQQQEVTTASQGLRGLTHWYIETNHNDLLADEEKEYINYPKLSLWQKVAESHARMWKINQGLTDHHNWQSSPYSWPLLLRGINYWVHDNKQVYFLGNAVVWWSVSVSIVVFFIHTAISVLKWHLGQTVAESKDVFSFNHHVFSYALGWLLHYAPFFIMGRQLFLHHYLPALYFGILVLGHTLEIFTGYLVSRSKVLHKLSYVVVTILVALSAVFYLQYSSLIYGAPWTKAQCTNSKALSGWDFDCNAFHENLADYSAVSSSSSPEATAAKETPFVKNEVAHEEQTVSKVEDEQKEQEEPVEESVVPPFEEEGTANAEEVSVADDQEIPQSD